MLWKTREGNFLIEGRQFPIHLSGSGYGVKLRDGREITTAAEYFEVSESGRLVKTFSRPNTTTLEDDLFVQNIYIVVGSELVRFFVTENAQNTSVNPAQIIRGLVAIGDYEFPFDAKTFTDRT